MVRKLTDPLPGTEQPVIRELGVQTKYLDHLGREIPNPTPLAPPVGYVKQPTIAELMRKMIHQVSFEAANAGAETEEEANDFDVDEDYEPESPWEHEFDINPVYEQMLALQSADPRNASRAPVVPPAAASSAAAPVAAPEVSAPVVTE